MRKLQHLNHRKGERGNVLFLILIAVALFAALSYAVTSSSRSGGGDANDEASLVNSASLTQYPAGVRTAIVRMMVSKGVAADELAFDKPPFTNVTAANEAQAVFYPNGGGAVYAPASADVMHDNQPGHWYFNGNFVIHEIGVNNNNDIIAFLPNVKRAICRKINSELGIAPPEDLDLGTAISAWDDMVFTASAATTVNNFALTGGTRLDTSTSGDLDGIPYGCFMSGTEYVYFHVLVER